MGYGLGNSMSSPGGSLIVAIIIAFLIVLAILWFLLPFAVFGTKAKLDDLKTELESTNKNLQLILAELKYKQSSDKDPGLHIPTNITATRD